ncbi:hypothetical protein FJY63_07355, partial [Candidatus Sumerlaeota bacterium]|nr:hypothetical protein [Candidatus Sumerlaeota bacterium]
MRVALISPYNDSCLGLRYIASFLRQHGHEVWLIAFKQYLSRPTTIEQLEKIRRPPPGGPPVMTQVLEEATYHLC